jgi:hypothetical protein
MFPYELDAMFEQIFSQKAASAAAGSPSSGQNKYFLPTSLSQRGKNSKEKPIPGIIFCLLL